MTNRDTSIQSYFYPLREMPLFFLVILMYLFYLSCNKHCSIKKFLLKFKVAIQFYFFSLFVCNRVARYLDSRWQKNSNFFRGSLGTWNLKIWIYLFRPPYMLLAPPLNPKIPLLLDKVNLLSRKRNLYFFCFVGNKIMF
jgi:hypothetical protein